MDFTFVTQCHCGCETFDVSTVKARNVKEAAAKLEGGRNGDERNVSIVAVFRGCPESLPIPSRSLQRR